MQHQTPMAQLCSQPYLTEVDAEMKAGGTSVKLKAGDLRLGGCSPEVSKETKQGLLNCFMQCEHSIVTA